MTDDEFEWDDAKAESNWQAHGISFEMARAAFNDPFGVEWEDDREQYGEQRFCLLGMVEGHLLFVAFTLRQGRNRIISARLAQPYERRKYHEDGS
jgi:uncharacterized protein